MKVRRKLGRIQRKMSMSAAMMYLRRLTANINISWKDSVVVKKNASVEPKAAHILLSKKQKVGVSEMA